MNYIEKILKFKSLINSIDAIVIGIGSGMSAAGGLDYTSNDVLKNLYKRYYDMGYSNIFSVIQRYWVTDINKANENDYWDFWSTHINNIRYKPGITKPYSLLFDLVKDKSHFVITTNADHQCQNVFDKVYAPQGDYSLFQCRVNCNDKVYNNKEFIDNYLNNKYVPKCECGDYLIPNLRCDNFFCETESSKYFDDYYDFIIKNKDKNLLLIEIGVGYNTPGIIRFPFDKLSSLDNVTLIRVNPSDCDVLKGSIGFDNNVLEVLVDVMKND